MKKDEKGEKKGKRRKKDEKGGKRRKKDEKGRILMVLFFGLG